MNRALAEAFEQGYQHGCQRQWESIRYRDGLIFDHDLEPSVIPYRNPHDPDDLLIKERATSGEVGENAYGQHPPDLQG